MSAVSVRNCLVHLKQVERKLAEQVVKAASIEEKRIYSDAMIQVSEVIQDMKRRIIKMEKIEEFAGKE
ncbi:hypothetical protein [Jeotgalibacillus campisalis]|uniref:Uncharacterized protein n=1 Tax=Jeotgalibacillus campisalis TaxID=220754 RepID=A0A0C2VRQ7_9BACL|nr:hypothetical protein [Jeotgalibacillus campisalis]KIL47121.1 hypothetical protein KR50_24430 [Jeotgalibacillus campisalis]